MDLFAAKLPAEHDSHRLVTDVIREPSRRLRTALGAGRIMRLTRYASHPAFIGRRLSLTTCCFSSLSAAQPSRSCRRRGCGCRFALCWRSSSRRAAAMSLPHARLRTQSPAARRRHSRCAGRNCRTRAAADFRSFNCSGGTSAEGAHRRGATTDDVWVQIRGLEGVDASARALTGVDNSFDSEHRSD